MARKELPPTHPDNIRDRMRISREALGFNQTTLSRLLGTPPSTWHNWEKGIRRISIDKMFKLQSVTGLTMEWIYRGDIMSLPAELRERIQTQISRNNRNNNPN